MLKDSTIKSNDIVDALYKKHHKDICFDELRLSSGFANPSRVDFLAINVGPSTGNLSTAYEIKVSRADFRRDSHKKQRGARLFADQFYYIAPPGVIPQEEIPDWAGLFEIGWTASKYANNGSPYLLPKKIISAPKLDKEAPSWGLVVSMIRNERKKK